MNGRAPKRPREPGPSDCCGSGCSRCVWDVYFDDLAKYEEFVKGLSGQGKETGGDEDDEFGSSSHDDDDDDDDGEAHDFVGSVVIKYVDAPTNEERVITPLVAVSKKLERFLPIHDVQLVSSSSSHEFDGNTLKEGQGQAVQIVDVLLENSCELKRPMNSITPSPGDVVEVFIPNDYDMHNSGYSGEVEKLCDRLNLNPSQWCEILRSPFVPPTHFPPWLPFQSQIQIRTLLAYFVDISSCGYLLRPTFFQTLWRLATLSKTTQPPTVAEKGVGTMELLETCASKEMAPFIYGIVMNGGSSLCYPRLIDMLNVFPFVKIPIERLLEVSGPLRPRRFSVSDYTLDDSSAEKRLRSIQLCLRRVDVIGVTSDNLGNGEVNAARILAEKLRAAALHRGTMNGGNCNGTTPFLFKGHVSHPLCTFGSRPHPLPMFVGTKMFGTTLFARGLKEAIMPFMTQTAASTTLPLLILVGAGTGIAPLVCAVHELVRYRQGGVGCKTQIPNCWVVYGARDFAELVYHRKLQEALELNAISRYDVSISRSSSEGYLKYVTDVLDTHSEELRGALLERGARLFACGPAALLKSLRLRLANNILSSNDDDESVREQRVLLLEKRGQLMFDVWSAVNIFE
ncbi:hypothetical protein ECC02_003234 [Trypanosoma cruzi]|uniref:Oxidoreductase-protein n=1 Tax=Trypanosoma cruzi TaxID=5693 RepID=A0A7J6YAR3_TRYCR|nr:hypothetical protein ECC02_003234 [Trypanosoma cruzi]